MHDIIMLSIALNSIVVAEIFSHFFCFFLFFFFFQAEDGIRDHCVTGVQTCALSDLCRGSCGRRVLRSGDEADARRWRRTQGSVPLQG